MNRARYLRRRATKYERILWRRLRNRNFAGHKFRRQHPVNPYTLDFYSPSLKLAIELDGSGHAYSLKRKHDETRNRFLEKQGIVVKRFWNRQVREELDSVMRAIWIAVEQRSLTPHLSPLPAGGGICLPW